MCSKRHLSKNSIIQESNGLYNKINIKSLFNYEALVMDKWVSNFKNNLDPKESKYRKALYEKYKFDSTANYMMDFDFKQLKSNAEALVSLINDPSWFDISFVIINNSLEIKDSDAGRFNNLRQVCIEHLIDYFE